jgi:chromosome segregation ATPase
LQSEAAHAHGLELQELRANSSSTIIQLQEVNRNSLEELKAEHASALETEVGSLNKHLNKLKLDLKATQDDLAKAKTSLEASRGEIESLIQQRNDARAQADATPAINPEQAAEFSRLVKELESIKDELAKTTDTLTLTKLTMAELSDKHTKELEEGAKGRADEANQLRAAHDAEVSDLATQKTELLVKLSDLEGDLATAQAALAAHEATSPKVNGTSHPPSPGVPREELQKLHEAHNLRIHDMQADHDKALKLAKEELEAALNNINESSARCWP